jgi:hypothetical protein
MEPHARGSIFLLLLDIFINDLPSIPFNGMLESYVDDFIISCLGFKRCNVDDK